MDERLREALGRVVSQFGEQVLEDPDRLRSLLSDELGTEGVHLPDEVGLLTGSIDTGLVGSLRSTVSDEELAEDLATRQGIAVGAAAEIVGSVRASVGVESTSREGTSASRTAEAVGARTSDATPPTPDDEGAASTAPPRKSSRPERRISNRVLWGVLAALLGLGALIAVGLLLDDDDGLEYSSSATATVGRCFSEIEMRGIDVYARATSCDDSPTYMSLGWVFTDNATEQCDVAVSLALPELWAQGDAEARVEADRCFAELTGVDRAPTDFLERVDDLSVGDCMSTQPAVGDDRVIPQNCRDDALRLVEVLPRPGDECAAELRTVFSPSDRYCFEPLF